MASYRRFVAYVYRYQNGRKGDNCGFVKVEAKNGLCTFFLRLQGIRVSGPAQVFVFVRKSDGEDFIPIGQVEVKDGLLHQRLDTDRLHMGGSGFTLEQCNGLLCVGENKEFYGTVWDDSNVIPKWDSALMRERERRAEEPEQMPGLTAEVESERKSEPIVEVEPERTSEPIVGVESQRTPEPIVEVEPERMPELIAEVEPEKTPESIGRAEVERLPEPMAGVELERTVESIETELERLPELIVETESQRLPELIVGTESERLPESIVGTESERLPESIVGAEQERISESIVEVESERLAELIIEAETEKLTGATAFAQPEKVVQVVVENEPKQAPETMVAAEAERMEEASVSQEKRPAKTFEEMWAYMQQEYARLEPFEDCGIVEGIKIAPSDIPYLQERNWSLGNNRFLLHGYKNYHHLLLGRVEGQKCYVLGVPGVYDQQEQFMAKMFGFPQFKPIRQCRNRMGQFGYWLRCIG